MREYENGTPIYLRGEREDGYFLDRNVAGWKKANVKQSTFSIWRKELNYNRKTITELRIEGETITNNESQILEAIEKYYNELNASVNNSQENDVDKFTEYLKIPKLTDAGRLRRSVILLRMQKSFRHFSKQQSSRRWVHGRILWFLFSIC